MSRRIAPEDTEQFIELLAEFAEWANLSNGPRPDVPWSTVADEKYLQAETLLRKYGRRIDYSHPPQRILDTRHPEWGEHPSTAQPENPPCQS